MIKKTILCMFSVLLLAACTQEVVDDRSDTSASKSNKNNTLAANTNVKLGISYLQNGNMRLARQKLNVALSQDPKSSVVLDGMAYFLERTGDISRAEKYYKDAISYNGKDGGAHNNYGAFLCRQKRYQAAQKEFMLAVNDADYMSPGAAYENAGLCALETKDKKQAEYYFSKALQNDPRLSTSNIELAKLCLKNGQYAKANGYIDKYMLYNGKNKEVLQLGIQIARKSGDNKLLASYAMSLKDLYTGGKVS